MPVWVRMDRAASRKTLQNAALSEQAIADVCERRLGVSKVHSLRHTFAREMHRQGAPVTVVQQRLGHSSLSTTSIYLSELAAVENEYADKLADVFGG
jgi:site-specific recombinase XerD